MFKGFQQKVRRTKRATLNWNYGRSNGRIPPVEFVISGKSISVPLRPSAGSFPFLNGTRKPGFTELLDFTTMEFTAVVSRQGARVLHLPQWQQR